MSSTSSEGGIRGDEGDIQARGREKGNGDGKGKDKNTVIDTGRESSQKWRSSL